MTCNLVSDPNGPGEIGIEHCGSFKCESQAASKVREFRELEEIQDD